MGFTACRGSNSGAFQDLQGYLQFRAPVWTLHPKQPCKERMKGVPRGRGEGEGEGRGKEGLERRRDLKGK